MAQLELAAPRAQVVSMNDARRLLGGVGRDKVYALDARGEIVSTKIDSRRVWFVDSIEAYIQRLREGGPVR